MKKNKYIKHMYKSPGNKMEVAELEAKADDQPVIFCLFEEGLVDCWADKRIACHARSRKSQGMKRISAVGSAWSACQRFIEGKPPIHHYRCWAIIQGLFESCGRTPVKVPKKRNHVRWRLCGLRWPFFVQLMKGDRQAIVVLTSPTICPPLSSSHYQTYMQHLRVVSRKKSDRALHRDPSKIALSTQYSWRIKTPHNAEIRH
ncbi:hypothetical protein B0T13DRAFT_22770 [Neurospora crassa]|nr:hypothetical protein B0T13DRAFT_22770 [Neurospora crassa]